MSDSQNTRTVIVTIPAGQRATWLMVTQILQFVKLPACVPYTSLLVRHSRWLGWITCWFSMYLIDTVTQRGVVRRAAGGRRSRLDLEKQATWARNHAGQHWWAWNNLIARTTPAARTWKQFQADVAKSKTLTMDKAREQFEAQPRIMAMLAYNSYPAVAFRFDIDELDEYQAGEAVFVALHWQQALTGDALVTPDGRLLEPASDTIADRLRYLDEATRIIHNLNPDQYIVAAKHLQRPDLHDQPTHPPQSLTTHVADQANRA